MQAPAGISPIAAALSFPIRHYMCACPSAKAGGNQGTLHDDVRLFLDDPASEVAVTKPLVEADHGRIETRTATVSTDIELHEAEGALAEALQLALPPQDKVEIFIPKRNNHTKGYVAGVPFRKHKMVGFNPNAPQQFTSA